MPYNYNGSQIKENSSWTDDSGVTHPRNWSKVWSDGEKTSAGLVWEEPEAPVVVESTVAEVKQNAIDSVNKKALELLEETDWMVVRKIDVGTEIPSATATYRASVRSAVSDAKTAIDGATTVAEVTALGDLASALPTE